MAAKAGNVLEKSGTTPTNKGAPERLHGAIARNLGVAIVSGRFLPGEVLENEVLSSENLHVSRSAYREALRILVAKGLVRSRPKTGTRVNERRQWNMLDPDVLAWFFEAGRPSLEFLHDLFELRKVIEPEAAALAARRRNADDIARMRRFLSEMERHGLAVEAGQIADREFHNAVIESSRNMLLVSLSSTVGAAVRWTTTYKQRQVKLARDPMPDHWRVFEAIALGDAQASREAMIDLIDQAFTDTQLGFGG